MGDDFICEADSIRGGSEFIGYLFLLVLVSIKIQKIRTYLPSKSEDAVRIFLL